MIYAFEDMELDEGCGELRRDGTPVSLEPQVFELLRLLVASGGRLVSRDELFRHIWGDRIVSDAALASRVRDARKAIGDDGTAQRLIRTIQRRGLRFLGGVSAVLPAAAAPVVSAETVIAARDPESALGPSIAVLPFKDVTSDTGKSILADGITDEIAAALCAWRTFSVVSRNTAFSYRDSTMTSGQIGQAIGARYLLSGSVRQSGSRIRINVVLTDTDRDQQVWAERISRDLGELIDLEEELAAQIVLTLMPEMESAEARRVIRSTSAHPAAWDLSMKAAWLANRGTDADYDTALGLASAAADLAPDWYLPYSLIAFCHFQIAMRGFSASDSRSAFSETLHAAQQALQVDGNSWMANALAAVGELWTNRNHERALLHVKKAIDLNPSAPQNYHFGGCITGFSGDPESAVEYQKRILRIDPVYPYMAVIQADLGLWHILDHNFDSATRRLESAENWDPRYGRTLQRRIALAGLQGDRELAQASARKLSALGLPLNRDVIADSYPFKKTEHRELFLNGLQRSGINF